MNITLGAGLEWRRGKGRLNGIYGLEALVKLTSHKDSYSYGNEMTSSNSSPTSTDSTAWPASLNQTSQPYASNQVNSRITENKDGFGFGFGIRGFLGVEYFFAPKMSLSGEFGWGPMIDNIGEGENTYQAWNGTEVTSSVRKTGKTSNFIIDTDNVDGAIVLSFYF